MSYRRYPSLLCVPEDSAEGYYGEEARVSRRGTRTARTSVPYIPENACVTSGVRDDSAMRRTSLASKQRAAALEKKKAYVNERRKEIAMVFTKACRVDLLFLVDCTGSMDPYIDEVKSDVTNMVESVKHAFPQLRVRLSFVGYRDFCDSERITVLPFTTSVERFKSYVGEIVADGGGDGPEDVFGGLQAAAKQDWVSDTRVLVHIADAPCHGRRFHGREFVDFPEHRLTNGGFDKRGLSAETVLTTIRKMGLVYYFNHVEFSATNRMIDEFRKIVSMHGYEIFETDLDETPQELEKSVVSAVKDSISSTLSTLTKGGNARGGRTLIQGTPAWSRLRAHRVIETWFNEPATIGDLIRGVRLEKYESEVRVKLAADPFDEGAQRYTYYGHNTSSAPGDRLVVIKTLKENGSLQSYHEHAKLQTVANFLANIFNGKMADCRCSSRVIEFVEVCTVRLVDTNRPFVGNMETYLYGEFEKFNNNCGYVANREQYHEALQAFSHWTYTATKGYLMVVDLQGIRDGGDYTLTDPAIHCTDLCRFGKTNLGEQGMSTFFKTHTCNRICKRLGLKRIYSSS